ncbi:multidrug resistance-associated protein 5-like isoform X1 [Branchiostoma floridae]|uniref:ATP-binding cassette sub-family C member 5 n=2 Tax=Branchiostoma floridae TaxID=7739 RepID=A0A9J7M0V7_BRAFL|nr:multidrug resistance-associated protein 5-like isoform X1 [Branchiostoma floridae]
MSPCCTTLHGINGPPTAELSTHFFAIMTKSSNENGSAIDSPVTREDQNGHHAANGGTATPTQASTTNLRETPPVDVKGKSKGKYSESMKILIPFRSTKKDRHIFPVDQSGLFSNIYSGWMNSIVWKATKGKVEEPDIYDLAPNDSSDSAGQRLWRLWQEEVQSRGIEKASYYRVMLRAIKTRWIVASLVLFCSLACSFISASVIIKELLAYAETTNPNINVGIALVCGMLCTEMIRVLAISFMFVLNYRTGVRLMGGSLSLVFKKILRLRSLKDKSVGELVNLLSNDGMRLFEFVAFGNFIVNTPLLFIPGIIYTCIILGPWALLGVLTFIVFLPLQGLFGKIVAVIRRKCVRITDRRVRMMSEMLTSVKLIKMYAWERPFAKTIGGIRAQERKMLETAGFVQAMSFAVTPAVPVIAAVLSFIGHTLSGNNLTPAQAFTVVSVFNSLRFGLALLPFSVRAIGESLIAAARIKSVLIMEELEPYKDKPSDRCNAIEITAATFGWDALDRKGEEKSEKGKDSGKMQNGGPPGGRGPPGKNGKKGKKGKKGKDGDKQEEEEEEKDKTIPTIFDIDLTLPKGSLLGVCGGVGSGKSSLISGILAQMRLLKGKVATDGNYAYVAQQAWILNSSVRDNILFGQPFDKEKYDRVCYACSLLPDFQQLPDGDQTEIGERGVNISGGQKQRVSLARALYADRDIYLLDDPLSAVDAHVGKHIFNNYVKKELKDKTVLFVTHQLQYLSDCDEIIVFNDGRITEKGKHRQLMNLNGEYANLILNFHEDEEDEEDADLIVEQEDVVIETESPLQRNPSVQRSLRRRDSKRASQRSFQRQDSVRSSMNLKRSYSIRSVHSTASETAGHIEEPPEREDFDPEPEGKKEDGDPQKLVTEEEKYKGTVAGATYWSYVKAGGGVIVCTLTMLLFILNTASMVFSNWWLTYWLNQGSGVPLNQSDPSTFNLTENPRLNFYILIYGMTVVAMLVIAVIKGYCYVKVTLGASSSMHDSVFASIFRCPMKFFDVTPTGRILNRFSRDLDEIDVRLPLTMQLFLDNVWVVFASILNVCIVFPWFLVALGPLGILFALVLVFFRHIIRELKRFDNVRRSPWFSHVTASIQGLSTIHAYEKNDNVMDKFATLLDKQNAAFLMYHYSTRWLAVRLDSVALSINVLAALMVVVFQGTIPASWAGLALSYAIQTSGLLQLCVRMASETESRFTCVERITHYADNLEQEAPEQIKGSDPPESWPDQGVLQFNRYQMRYRESLPLVLKDIQCNIRPRESVGIVGRTGSGKSSLGVALFRLVEPSGGSILIDGVDTSKIGLQSLRSKLSIIPQDPVLFVGTIRYNLDPFNQYKDPELWRALERTYMKDAISNLEKQLEAPVVENGENFSVGERQLICMARALLRNSKIILLDEATAAIDSETDSLIQKTIHEAFTDCTMLTIAHRLNTVLNSDRIMVMEDGKLVEFDTPAALMSDPNSRFSAMMAATGSDVSKYLANNPVPALPDVEEADEEENTKL